MQSRVRRRRRPEGRISINCRKAQTSGKIFSFSCSISHYFNSCLDTVLLTSLTCIYTVILPIPYGSVCLVRKRRCPLYYKRAWHLAEMRGELRFSFILFNSCFNRIRAMGKLSAVETCLRLKRFPPQAGIETRTPGSAGRLLTQ